MTSPKTFNNTKFYSFSDQPSLANVGLANTLALPARAECAVAVKSVAQLQTTLVERAATDDSGQLLVLGSGSNVVLPDIVAGLTVLMQIRGISELASESNRRTFDVGAGESWQGFVRFCLGQGLGGGIENLTLIPGTVGAAPIQNIGAYGVEVSEFIRGVEAIDATQPERSPVWLDPSDCQFGYRDSLFKRQPGRWIITCVRFRLAGAETGACRLEYSGIEDELRRMGCECAMPTTVSEAVSRLRRSKLPDPRQHPNVGSFFKNPWLNRADYERLHTGLEKTAAKELAEIPRWNQSQNNAHGVKLAAAALIERAGFKTKPADRVKVWFRQPLVLINRGGANAADVKRYSQTIRDRVQERFGVLLEQEPVEIKNVS